jgi:tetratricopeptide (TPR) repeat protein
MQNELRAAMALSSIEAGKWEDKGSTQDKTDLKDALINQLLQGTIHDAEQAQILIDKFESDLATTDSVDVRRKLADAYMIKEDFEAAYREYSTVAEKLGVSDPVLDKQIERAKLAQLDKQISQLRENGSSEDEINAAIQQRDAYHEERVVGRSVEFPNDIQLQFDLAELRFEQGRFDEAKSIFETVCENPQKRRASLVYLGRCALHQGDTAAAEPLLDTAVKDMYRMDKYRREALYYLAIAYEGNGKKDEALECYKTIRANMENYRDIQERIAAIVGETGGQQ